MEQMNLMDLFGFELETPKAGREEKKSVKSSKVVTDTTDVEELDEDSTDDEDFEEGGDEATPAKKPQKSKSSSTTGKSPVTLPVKVRMSTAEVEIDELEDKTYNGLKKKLFELGYKDVAGASLYLDGKYVYIVPDKSTTAFDVQVSLPVTVADGMMQMELTSADFPDKDADEISIFDIQERWQQTNAEYDCGFSYRAKAKVLIPIMDQVKKLKVEDFPITVSKCGVPVTIQSEDVKWDKGECSMEEIKKFLFGASAKIELDLAKLGNEYRVYFKGGKATSIFTVADIGGDGKVEVKKAVQKIVLPAVANFQNAFKRVALTSELFGGKTKVTVEEILRYMGTMYSVLKDTKGRNVETFYVKEENALSIAIASGKKG